MWGWWYHCKLLILCSLYLERATQCSLHLLTLKIFYWEEKKRLKLTQYFCPLFPYPISYYCVSVCKFVSFSSGRSIGHQISKSPTSQYCLFLEFPLCGCNLFSRFFLTHQIYQISDCTDFKIFNSSDLSDFRLHVPRI